MQKAITINSKEISLLKPITSADYKSKTILTDSAWEYVELWFKRQKDEKSKNALFYWQQAKHFFLASEKLPQNSKPLCRSPSTNYSFRLATACRQIDKRIAQETA